MVTAAKTISQIITHTSIAFALTYGLTGSLVFGGLAAILEPVINVMLLPLHEYFWENIRHKATYKHLWQTIRALEKISQTFMHMSVAFIVMYWATGSMAFGGLAAVLEPILNVILMPFHDRAWENLRAKCENKSQSSLAMM